MDRLSTVELAWVTLGAGVVAVALGACGGKSDTPAAPLPSRTDGAKVKTGQAASTDAFCDLHAASDKAAAFRWPELAPGSTAPGAATTWRWVNVWATWCEPCIEEMPRLSAWRDKLVAAGVPVELAFVSVDDDEAEVAAFQKAHPGIPPSIRIANAEQRTAWLKSFGLSDGAIPIHMFVSPTNRLRCVRAGGIRDKDYAVIEKLLGE
jgi:thiol-disulfide isomerase/thioredoxin